MGCNEMNGDKIPTLICFFEPGNESQREYCLKLKDNFNHINKVKYIIRSSPDENFRIKFKIKEKIYDIQNYFDDSDQQMHNALNDIYKILDEN